MKVMKSVAFNKRKNGQDDEKDDISNVAYREPKIFTVILN